MITHIQMLCPICGADLYDWLQKNANKRITQSQYDALDIPCNGHVVKAKDVAYKFTNS